MHIGLAGKSGSGKDLVADYICGKLPSYEKIAVADGIREEANEFLSHALLSASIDRGIVPISFKVVWEAYTKSIWAKPTSPEMRVLLQWWGTEYRRNQDAQYWTKKLDMRLMQNLTNEEKPRNFVVSDIRTPEEVAVVRANGGEVWFVERPGVESVGITNHYTEIALEGAKFDRKLLNNGTIGDLLLKVDEILVLATSTR